MKTATAKIMLSKAKSRIKILLAVLALAFSCKPESGDPTGGETHFFDPLRCKPKELRRPANVRVRRVYAALRGARRV